MFVWVYLCMFMSVGAFACVCASSVCHLCGFGSLAFCMCVFCVSYCASSVCRVCVVCVSFVHFLCVVSVSYVCRLFVVDA